MNKKIIAKLGILALAACLIAGCQPQSAAPQNQKVQTAYERVVETGIIRVGYVPYPPGLIKDPNTKKITGIFAEVLEEAAHNLDLKVEWTEQVGWGTMVEGLKANRYLSRLFFPFASIIECILIFHVARASSNLLQITQIPAR